MKAKIFFILMLLVAGLISCDNNGIKAEDEDSTVFSYHRWGGGFGVDENLKITKDYTFYSIQFSSPFMADENYSDKIATSPELWNTLLKSFDLETFNKIQSGKSEVPIDGVDVAFTVTIEGKEYSFFNGYDDKNYKKMQKFFDTILESVSEFSNNK